MNALCQTLADAGYATTGFTSANKALALLREQRFDLVLTDLLMPDMDGISLLREAQAIDPDLLGIVMTGHAAIDTAIEAMKAGALEFLTKPVDPGELLSAVRNAIERSRTLCLSFGTSSGSSSLRSRVIAPMRLAFSA